MIFGTNLEFCISDLLHEEVDIDTVYCIVTYKDIHKNTETLDNWWKMQIDPMTAHWSQGRNSLYLFDYDTVVNLITELHENGTILNRDTVSPSRAMDFQTMALKEHWYTINLREKDMEPAVKMAWDHYRMLAGLCK